MSILYFLQLSCVSVIKGGKNHRLFFALMQIYYFYFKQIPEKLTPNCGFKCNVRPNMRNVLQQH